jgi:hypothetical protein
MLELPDARQAAAKSNGDTVVTAATAAATPTNAAAMWTCASTNRNCAHHRLKFPAVLAPPVSSPSIGGGWLILLGVFVTREVMAAEFRAAGISVECRRKSCCRRRAATPSTMSNHELQGQVYRWAGGSKHGSSCDA